MSSKRNRFIVLVGTATVLLLGIALILLDVITLAHGFLATAAFSVAAGLVLFWGILAPLLGLEGAMAIGLTEAQRQRLDLLRQKDTALAALKDLEFDRAMGKMDEADFAAMRKDLEQQAIHSMRALDKEQAKYERSVREEIRQLLERKGVRLPMKTGSGARGASPGRIPVGDATRPIDPPRVKVALAAEAANAGPLREKTRPSRGERRPTAETEDEIFRKLEKLAALREKGAITEDDFERKKRELLERI